MENTLTEQEKKIRKIYHDAIKLDLEYQVIEKYEQKLRGNWKKYTHWMWLNEPKDSDNWGEWQVSSPCDGLTGISNESVIHREFAPLIDESDKLTESGIRIADAKRCKYSYWIRVYRSFPVKEIPEEVWENIPKKYRKYTPAFLLHFVLQYRIDHSKGEPLDRDDYEEKNQQNTIEEIIITGNGVTNDKAPDDWAWTVYNELPEEELENHYNDDSGASPSAEAIEKILKQNGWLNEEKVKERYERRKAYFRAKEALNN